MLKPFPPEERHLLVVAQGTSGGCRFAPPVTRIARAPGPIYQETDLQCREATTRLSPTPPGQCLSTSHSPREEKEPSSEFPGTPPLTRLSWSEFP